MYDAMTTIYFSPTGGTALAARQMREAFGLPGADIDVTGPQAAVTPRTFGPGELVLFAAPVYAGRVPAVEGLFGQFTGSGTPCVLVLAYGNRHYDEAAAQLKHRLERQGFVCVGAVCPITPHIFAKGLCDDRPDEADRAEYAAFAAAVKAKLAAGELASAQVPGDPDPEPKPAVPVPRALDETKCVRCGRCSAACPTGALAPDLKTDPARCISCMHCVAVCPQKALSYDAPALRERLFSICTVRRPVEWFV